MKLRLTPTRLFTRATAFVRNDPVSVKTGFVSLVISMIAGLIAGIVLGSITKTLVALPGLVVLAPAAIGLRGNVFGALASRLSTIAQLGDLRFSKRLNTTIGQNLVSSTLLSLSCSFFLAGIAKIVSEAFGIKNAISYTDFFVISILGGLIPTLLVMIMTIFLALACVKKQWDLDNVGAPLITATGDMVTIPSLVLATLIVNRSWITVSVSILASIFALTLFVYGLATRQLVLRRIYRESFPLLIVGGFISILAGLTVQGRISSLSQYPIFIMMVPPLLSLNGAIGSIFSARVSTKLHLGLVRSEKFTLSPITEDITLAYVLSVPIFMSFGIFCGIYSNFGHLTGPGIGSTIVVAFIAGIVSTTLSNIVGYLTAVMSYRFGLDPDNFAVPAVTSLSDLIGAVILMLAIGVLNV
ncbi:MAG: magnesium transporter [Acidimicrobiia bacterium]